ncbi:MAG: hypothetical protein AAFQ43_04110 [Bacteroidota bacterium]
MDAPATDDPVLADLLRTVPVPVVESTGDVFHDLVSCLVEQQIHYRSTKGTFQRVLERAGLHRVTPDTFDAMEAALDGVTLSRQKREALAGAAAAFRGDLPGWTAPDWPLAPEAEVRRALSALRGVGPWTVDMIALYTLGYEDVFPVGDYHLKKGMARLYDLNEGAGLTREMTSIAEGWRPHRSRAVLTLLAWKDWQAHLAR